MKRTNVSIGMQCAVAICLSAVAAMMFVDARVNSERPASGSAEPSRLVEAGMREPRPNILLVITDDQTKGTLSPTVMPTVMRYLVAATSRMIVLADSERNFACRYGSLALR
jgi:hypothetical protein